MSNDRLATLRHAEDLARRGKLDAAIAECTRLLEAQPRDWNTANLLGDLLVKQGQVRAAIDQFTRAAEIIAAEGFDARACALYKKILKLQPDADHALMQAGELSARQGLIADARAFFEAAGRQRGLRGDARGALQARVRLGTLDPADVNARLDGARARLELGDHAGALRELTDLGLQLLQQERGRDALGILRQVVALDPANTTVAYIVELLSRGRTTQALAIVDGTVTNLDALEPLQPLDAPEALPPLESLEARGSVERLEPAVEAASTLTAADVVVAQARVLKPPPAAGRAVNALAVEAPAIKAPADDIEDVFARLRRDAAGVTDDAAAQIALTRGLAFLEAGDVTSGVDQLRIAARSPRHRYTAAVRLARSFEERRQIPEAIEWLTHALDAPALDDGERSETLLHLSTLLEQQGETARALATCLELQAHAGTYGDSDERIARLTRAQAGG